MPRPFYRSRSTCNWRRRRWLPLIVLGAGLLVRLASWNVTFQSAGVALLGDSDPHYHVLRAERILRSAAGAPWRDPSLNWPDGAEIPWPPLFDAAIAGASRLVFGVDATRNQIALLAAFLPVGLGLLTLPLVAALGRQLLGKRRGWLAALFVALLPAHAGFTVIGRPDQHAAELLLFVAILLCFARTLTATGRALTEVSALALLVSVAFWTWQGSALLLVVPLLFALLWHVAAPDEDPTRARVARALAVAGAGSAFLLAGTLAVFGPSGAPVPSPSIAGVNGLAVAITVGTGVAGLLLLALDRTGGPMSRWRRATEAIASVAFPAAALFVAFPRLRSGVAAGVSALLRGNGWYADIQEFRPVLFDGITPALDDLGAFLGATGLVLLAAAASVPVLRRAWRRPEARSRLSLLALTLLIFLAGALMRRRFIGYMLVAAALPAEVGVRAVAAVLARKVRSVRWLGRIALPVTALVVVAPAIPADVRGVGPLPHTTATAMETFIEARKLNPPAGREAVLAPWTLGHLVQYFWDRPVVVSPFGVEGGAGALEAWAAFFFAKDPELAEAAARSRRVAWVVVDDPAEAAERLHSYAPPGAPRFFDVHEDLWNGSAADETPAYWELVPARLYHGDGRGGGPADSEPLTGFRLVLESPPAEDAVAGAEPLYKVFGVVSGARITVAGARPRGLVEATAKVRTNLGRSFSLSISSRVDPTGRALLRLPYASGWNGVVWADAWLVTDGHVLGHLRLTEEDVIEGRAVTLLLPEANGARPHAPRGPAAAPPP